jgi:predicted NUDIX family NTP pyrophosphohydrolase
MHADNSDAWPSKPGRWQEFPEADHGEWFDLEQTLRKTRKGQNGFPGGQDALIT